MTKQYKTITQAAKELELPQHTLRTWEKKFTALAPIKLEGNRRYYNDDMMKTLKAIKHLIYEDGYSIESAQKMINDAPQTNAPKKPTENQADPQEIKKRLKRIIITLKALRAKMSAS